MTKRQDTFRPERGVIEADLANQGLKFAGVDEVGRGCIAGPVFAACVELDFERLMKLPKSELALIRDSKTLSASQRAQAVDHIKEISIKQHIGISTIEEIEEHNILQATFIAMLRAITGAGITPEHLILVDGRQTIGGYKGPQQTVIKGDQLCYCIAAASILAKEARDAYMKVQAKLYPEYDFDQHVGYATSKHLSNVAKYGPCKIHRKLFEPIKSIIANQPAAYKTLA